MIIIMIMISIIIIIIMNMNVWVWLCLWWWLCILCTSSSAWVLCKAMFVGTISQGKIMLLSNVCTAVKTLGLIVCQRTSMPNACPIRVWAPLSDNILGVYPMYIQCHYNGHFSRKTVGFCLYIQCTSNFSEYAQCPSFFILDLTRGDDLFTTTTLRR